MKDRRRVLVMDDEQSMRELLEIILGNDGYEVKTAPDVASARNLITKESFDAVVTDLRIGTERNAGMELVTWMGEHARSTPVVMVTAHGSVESAVDAMKRGATDYILKPFKNDEIRLLVRRAIEQRDLRRENQALRSDQSKHGRLDNMVGNSAAIERVRDMVRRVASLPSTIAIHGESGTGKELVARGIHELSGRAAKPFVAINCGGIPENLLESELFGHRRGAFTGAVDDKEGLFVTADGGTLFLDEIGEMPFALQVKLLRVLDNNEVMPVGGTASFKVDVHIVSATNRDLEKMTQDGIFREDLYYRLNVIPVYVPALRERADDIPLLARHFIETHAKRLSRPRPVLAEEAVRALAAYDWPGNVRELQNVMERAVALCSGEVISTDDLPRNVQLAVNRPAPAITDLPVDGIDLEKLVTDTEIRLIRQALEKARHNQTRAAKLLRLSPRTLRYRLQKYGLDGDQSAGP